MQLLEPIKQRKPRGDISITKPKIKDKDDDFSIEIIYDLPPESHETKTVRFKCQEQPTPGFWQAVGAILKWAMAEAGLIPEVWATASVPEINFKETEEGVDVAFALRLEVEDKSIALKLSQKNISYELQSKVDELVFEIESYVGAIGVMGSSYLCFKLSVRAASPTGEAEVLINKKAAPSTKAQQKLEFSVVKIDSDAIIQRNQTLQTYKFSVYLLGDNTVLCKNGINKIAPTCLEPDEGGLTPSVNHPEESYMNLTSVRVLRPNCCVSSVHPNRAFNQGGVR